MDINEIHFPHLASVQSHRPIAKMLMAGDGHHLWSWPENREEDFLRTCIVQIAPRINIVHIPLEASVHPPQLRSQQVRTAHDGVLVCSLQVWVILELKVFTRDTAHLVDDCLCLLLVILLHRLMVGNPLVLPFWATTKLHFPHLVV